MKVDHQHNLEVLKNKSGTLVLARRKHDASFDINDYGPCPLCFAWLELKELARHNKSRCIATCNGPESRNETATSSSAHIKAHSKILKGENKEYECRSA